METQAFNKPLSEILTAVSGIEGIDIALALDRISGKQEVLEGCIEQTADSIEEKLKKMNICLSHEDLPGFSIEAHGLKGALAGIGAMELSGLASGLEMESKSGNEAWCKKEFILFSHRMKALAAELKSAFPQVHSEVKSRGSKELLLQAARETAACLGLFEADDALGALSRLDVFTFGAETDALLDYIRNRVIAYKYDEAINLLKCIINEVRD